MIEGNPAIRQKFDLALTLHKSVSEIDQISVAEFNGWVAYLTSLKDK